MLDESELHSETLFRKKDSLWVKCYQTASHATGESFMKGRVNRYIKLQETAAATLSAHSGGPKGDFQE